ncbi:MAG: hypothetical protein ACI4EO_01810 [Blautia sp.]
MSYRAVVITIFSVLTALAIVIAFVSNELGKYIEDVMQPYDCDLDEEEE